ncbi:hypothetical protein I4U23_023644 [Adineta vaga]|nr:hypothetical protein I4U23_023644 [Adineta vaga]
MSTITLLLRILIFIKLALNILLVIFACIYALPLCILFRFRSSINIMTVNVCIAFIASAIFWIIAYMLHLNDQLASDIISQQRCSYLNSIETIFNCYVIYSLCSVSINRFCIIRYTNRILFKTKYWAFFCIIITWFTTVCLTLPNIILSNIAICEQIYGTLFLQLYTLTIVVIFPSCIFVTVNILIFTTARRSSRRVRVANSVRVRTLNNRDIHLLKHMIIIFVIFVVGWAPIYVLLCIDYGQNMAPIIYRGLSILPALSLLINILDLFLFNHSLRQYFYQLFIFRALRIQTITLY